MDSKPSIAERRQSARFALQMPMRYRALEDTAWHEGRTENVGKSGVFFLNDNTLRLAAPVEMVLSFPVELGGEAGATTICRGRIVRAEPRVLPDGRAGMAATIDSFLMTHGDPRRI